MPHLLKTDLKKNVIAQPHSFVSANRGELAYSSVPEPFQGGSEFLKSAAQKKTRLQPLPSSHCYNPVQLLGLKVRDRVFLWRIPQCFCKVSALSFSH